MNRPTRCVVKRGAQVLNGVTQSIHIHLNPADLIGASFKPECMGSTQKGSISGGIYINTAESLARGDCERWARDIEAAVVVFEENFAKRIVQLAPTEYG